MVAYRYDGSFDGFLCCVFESYIRREVPVQILPEEEAQVSLYPEKTSKEILQLLNEKPETEDSAKPAQSGGAKAAEAKTSQGRTSEKENGDSGASGQETSPAAAAASQDGAAAAAETDGEIPADAAPGSRSGEDALDSQEAQANEQTYEGEDQEMEGGWIEDAAEDGTQ